MAKDYLEYETQNHHHAFDMMKVRYEYSEHQQEVLVCIQVPDGGGFDSKDSSITLTLDELEKLLNLGMHFQKALKALKGLQK